MFKKNFLRAVPAVLTLALVACEDSITGIVDPVAEVAPTVEAVASAALLAGQVCEVPGLTSWWAGEDIFDDIANPLDGTTPNDIAFISDPQGVRTAIANGGTVAFQEGLVGQAFSFTSVGGNSPPQFLEVRDAPDLEPQEFTVDFWAKRTGSGQHADDAFGNVLIEKPIDDVVGGTSYSIHWKEVGPGQGRVLADVNLGGIPDGNVAGDAPRLVGPIVLNDTWVHVALTVGLTDDGNHKATLYIDGVPQDNPLIATADVAYGPGSIVIGATPLWARNFNVGRGFHGLIDEVGLFNRALSEEEIQRSLAGGKCAVTQNPNTPPVVSVGPYEDVNEGGHFGPTVSIDDEDSGSWTATVDYGDGYIDPDAFAGTATNFDLSHTYAQDGEYTVTVTVTDDAGAEGSASATVVVHNVVPTVDAGPDSRILEGDTFESAGSFTDPGADFWTATVDYGDGSGPQALELAGMTFELSHMYADNGSGPFMVTVTVEDGSGPVVATLTAGAGYDSGADQAMVTVVYPLTIDQATVRSDRRGRGRRRSRDAYDVDGRLPLSLLERFDSGETLTVGLAGLVLEIPAGSLVRRNHRSDKMWHYTAGWQRSGIRRFELRDDGRFKIQATGLDLYGFDFSGPVDFFLSLGPDIGEASIQLDGELQYRSRCGGECRGHDDGDDDDGDDAEDGDGHEDDNDGHDGDDDDDDDNNLRRSLKRLFRRGR